MLVRNQEIGKWRELRLETRASWLSQDLTVPSNAQGVPDEHDSWILRTRLVYRNAWSLFRLTVDYIDGDYR